MSENDIDRVLNACNEKHIESRKELDKYHLKEVKKAINTRVGLPIGILCALLGWVLIEIYGFKSDMTGLQMLNDTQTLSIAIEGQMREKTDIEIRNELKALSDRFDNTTKWLIENMTSKYRGRSPFLPDSQIP